MGANKKFYPKVTMARTYRDTHGMEMPTLKLARILYVENNLLFKSVEDARSTLRQIEGKRNKFYNVTHPHPPRVKNPYNIPASDEME